MSASNTDTNLTASSYSFVPELIKEEYTNLRAALQLAQKRERTATRAEREDRTAERERLEREVDRARTRLDVAKRAEREREVMKQVKTEQKERAKEGKGTFHLKRGQYNRAGEAPVSSLTPLRLTVQGKRRICFSKLGSTLYKHKAERELSRRRSRRSKRRWRARKRRVDHSPRVRLGVAGLLVEKAMTEREGRSARRTCDVLIIRCSVDQHSEAVAPVNIIECIVIMSRSS
jgi:hypothetical protein